MNNLDPKSNKWISVEESLPEPSKKWTGKSEGECLNKVMIFSPSTIGISTGYYWGDSNDPMKGWCTMGVTHWQPLPEPPKPETV